MAENTEGIHAGNGGVRLLINGKLAETPSFVPTFLCG
jgi:hypothetical protein